MVKRFLLSLALLAATSFSLFADELTVNDGTTTNSYLPIYGLYLDTQGSHSQFIQPAADLADAEGGTITKLTFYSSATKTYGGTQQFRLTEVAESDLSGGFASTSESNVVYAGGLTIGDGVMEIELSTPYTYNGGNLLVEWYCAAYTTYSSCQFFGVSATNAGRYATSATAAGSTQNFRPKMTLEYTVGTPATCAKPASRAAITSVESDMVSLEWGAAEGATTYQYSIVASGEEADWTNAQTVNATSVTIDGLTPNTAYDFYVRTYCSADDQSTSQKTSFRTECAAIAVADAAFGFEQAEGFTRTGIGNAPYCWVFGNLEAPSNTSYIPYIQTNGYTTYTSFGSQCLYLNSCKSSYTSADGAYAVLPQIDFGGNLPGHHMTMQIRKSSATSSYSDYNDTLYVGVTEDPTDLTHMQIIGYAINTTTSWEKVDVVFNRATINDGYIVLFAQKSASATASSKYGAFYVDNIEVKVSKSCATPTGTSLEALTATSADLSWNGDAAQFRVCVSATAVNPDTVTTWLREETTSTASITLDNLTPATTYYVYVQGVCGEGEDNQSDFANGISFTTECLAHTEFPWSEDFEQMPLDVISTTCWSNEHISGTGSYLFKVLNTSNGGNLTRQGCLPDMSAGTITRLALPIMDFPEANAYMLSIDVYRNASGSSYPTEGLRIIAGSDTLGFISRNYSVADGTRIPAETASGWYTYELVIPSAGLQHIYIQGESRYGSSTYFDNLVVDRVPTCVKVSDIHLVENSETQDGATIAWTPGTEAPQYRVVATVGSDTVVNAIVTEPQYTFEGLAAGHRNAFVVSVQALCSEDDNSKVVSTPISFDTKCAVISALPWTEGFENFATGFSAGAPLCWEVLNFNAGSSTTYPVVYVNNNSSYVQSGSKSLFMQSGAHRHGIAILPEFDSSIDLSRQEIAFWYRNEGTTDYNGTLEVGYITDIADSATFVALRTLEKTTTKTEVLQPLAEVPAGARLAFQYIGGTNSNYNVGIDDIVVRKLTTCFKPSAIHAIDSLATTSSATIAWTAPEQGAAQYRLTVTKGNDTLVNNVLTADTFYVIENLAHSSNYRISATVNSVCGEEDESEAVTAAVVVSTLCATITEFPWSEDFENYTAGISANDVNCFSTFDVVGNANDWKVNTTAHNSNRSLYCQYTGSGLGRTVGAVELPEMLFEEGKLYTINYWLQGSSNSTSDTITVYVGDTVLHTFVSADDLGSSWNEFNDTIVGNGETTHIGLTFNNLDGYFVYLDDIIVDLAYKNVTFQNFDSTELQSGRVVYGEMPVYEGETPVKPATAQYTYTFKGWDTELAAATEDAVYTAQFDSVVNEYQIVFQNYDGTVLQSTDVAYGEQPAYVGETPVKPATAQYTYTFKGWDVEPALVEATATYTAEYDSVVNVYLITFKNYDGTVLEADSVAYGETPAYAGATPEQPATAQYTFTFKGWEPALAAVEADAVYTAQYDSAVNNYTVFFKDWDGTILAEELIPYGGAAVAPEDPVREGYTFIGWDADYSNITGPLTVNAQYELYNGLDNVDATKAVKFIKDGQMYIRRGDELFDATGRKVE